MTEFNELRELVHRSGWPPVDPDGAGTIRRAAARRTRRNAAAVLGGAVAVVSAIAVAPVTLGDMFDSQKVDAPPGVVSGQGTLGVTDGYRPVGALGLVFEVPTAWGTEEVACDGSPVADTVAFGGGRHCMVPKPPEVSSLLITTDDNHLVAPILPHVRLASADLGAGVTASDPVQLDGLWTFAVADQSGQIAVVRTQDQVVARHIRDALRAIPDGYVTIPVIHAMSSQAASSSLASLGLTSSVRDVARSGSTPGQVLGFDPPLGALVPVGGHVSVLVASS